MYFLYTDLRSLFVYDSLSLSPTKWNEYSKVDFVSCFYSNIPIEDRETGPIRSLLFCRIFFLIFVINWKFDDWMYHSKTYWRDQHTLKRVRTKKTTKTHNQCRYTNPQNSNIGVKSYISFHTYSIQIKPDFSDMWPCNLSHLLWLQQ